MECLCDNSFLDIHQFNINTPSKEDISMKIKTFICTKVEPVSRGTLLSSSANNK